MKTELRFLAACSLLLSAPQLPLAAQGVTISADLNGANEVPPNGSTATGEATFNYDPTTNLLSGSVTVTGMTATQAHLHLGPAGVNGPIVDPMTGGPDVWNLTTTLSPALEILLLNEGLYINVHSAPFPGGETRGQAMLNYRGLEHRTIGQAQIEITPTGTLRVSNLGSSGQDGVRISLGEVEGFQIMELDDMIPGQAPDGAFSSWTCLGQVSGQPDQVLLTHRNEVIAGVVATSVDFSSVRSHPDAHADLPGRRSGRRERRSDRYDLLHVDGHVRPVVWVRHRPRVVSSLLPIPPIFPS